MAKARYCSDCLGHFGLASKFYCHFTSPIRRYPDLYIHRIIKSYLHGENSRSHFAGLVDNAAEHSSEMERNAVDAERASDDIKICQYMADRIGEHYDGVISSIIDVGCFVRLENTIEGFVPFRSLHDHYFFDDRSYRAIGARGGKILSIGMPVTVVVEKVDTEENKIDFSFEYGFEEERDPSQKRFERPVKKGRKGSKNSPKGRSGGRARGSFAGSSKGAGTGGSKGDRTGGSKGGSRSSSESFGGFVGKPGKGRSGRGGSRGRK